MATSSGSASGGQIGEPRSERSTVSSQLDEGIRLARSGNNVGARDVFRRIIHATPDNEDAWLWLAWVAESQEKSLHYLEEAQALLPDSARITEGVHWAREQHEGRPAPAPAPRAGVHERAPSPHPPVWPPPRMRSAVSGAVQTAQAIRQTAHLALERLGGSAAAIEWPEALFSRWSGITLPALSCVAVVAMLAFVFMGINNARDKAGYVEALALPTPALDATATPTAKQITQPLWVQVDVAKTQQDWETAISLLQQIRQADPHSDAARTRLAEAYYQHSIVLIQANELEQAGMELDLAIRLDASSENLQKARGELKQYLTGVEAYWMRDWARVVDDLRRVYRVNPNFRDTHVMLAQAYYELGMERQTAEVWDEARNSYQAALDLMPEMPDARKRLAQVMDILIPPKRVEVDLSDMRVTLFENHKPVHVYSCCTGRPDAPTLPGRYQVLDKLPMAYASKWDLNMPWWLGIYWAGGSENGFHALPILSNGRVLWSGYLGQTCSFGCIVLDTPDAKFLYDWADIGMTVIVTR